MNKKQVHSALLFYLLVSKHTMSFAQEFDSVGAHERETEDRNVDARVLERHALHVAGQACVDESRAEHAQSPDKTEAPKGSSTTDQRCR